MGIPGLRNPFSEIMKGIDIVINSVGQSKPFNSDHTRIMDFEVNRLLVDAAK